MKWLAVAMLVAASSLVPACDRRRHVTSCDSDLHGVWVASHDSQWMILDQSPASLEIYPLFADADAPPDIVAAPRVIDLHRDSTGLAGTLKKRYMQRAESCEAHVAVHVMSCADDTLEVELADVRVPLAITPCTWPAPAPSRVERWRRE